MKLFYIKNFFATSIDHEFSTFQLLSTFLQITLYNRQILPMFHMEYNSKDENININTRI